MRYQIFCCEGNRWQSEPYYYFVGGAPTQADARKMVVKWMEENGTDGSLYQVIDGLDSELALEGYWKNEQLRPL